MQRQGSERMQSYPCAHNFQHAWCTCPSHLTLRAKVLEALHQGCNKTTSPATPPVLQTSTLLLVGDPQQLPPTVRSREAAGLGLGVTLLQRLTAMGLEPLLLDTQYRMHPGEWVDGC